MARQRSRRRPSRRRVGRVSYYLHHGAWWVYFREGDSVVRRRIADNEADAERIAAQLNAQLASETPTLLTFQPIQVGPLREQFLAHHETVLRSSIGTVRRYQAATRHLLEFMEQLRRPVPAHELPVDRFVAFLRTREVAPNGHPNTTKRRLRDKGVRYILEVCRSMYGFAQRRRHLPPYVSNPFSDVQIDRMQIDDAKPIQVFTAETELQFFAAANDWAFPIHCVLAKTGLRSGELVHLLIEDLDLDAGWLHVRNKAELGWRIKTRTERTIPVISEVAAVLKAVIGSRKVGPVFLRERFANVLPPLVLDRRGLAHELADRVGEAAAESGEPLPRDDQLRLARSVWRDAGAVKADRIRESFIRVMNAIGVKEATCPKSWRHTFATLLQDANVDPLVRQITVGHKPVGATGGLGMTEVYTHTRPETQKREIERAMRLWPESLLRVKQWTERRNG